MAYYQNLILSSTELTPGDLEVKERMEIRCIYLYNFIYNV